MMIDNIGGSSPGVKVSAGPQSARHTGEASAHPSATAAAATAITPDTVNRVAVEAAVKDMNEFIRPATSSVEFSLDEDSGRTIVKMIDTETNKVVRQFPSEEALAISKALDRLQGLTLRVRA
jgi:flagellar protein FlaG